MAAPRKRSFNEYTHEAGKSSHMTENGTETVQNGNKLVSNGRTATTNLATEGAPPRFEAAATIVLVGIKGTGKSSLAFLAAGAYNRRVIEYEREFSERTGQSLTTHRQSEKNRAGRKKRQEVLQKTLDDNSHGAVIVCDFSDLEYGSTILVNYSQRHPVIYVERDVQGVHDHLHLDIEKVSQLSSTSARMLRECSNFEFYNLTETEPEPNISMAVHIDSSSISAGENTLSLPSLKLKRTERDFLKFLRMVLGDHSRAPSQHSAYPLSELPLHSRSFTYAATIDVEQVLDATYDLESYQVGSDAFQLIISRGTQAQDRQVLYSKISRAFAIVRRATILPIILDPCLETAVSPNDYADLWRTCRRLAPEYVTLDLGQQASGSLVSAKGNIRIIGVSNVESWTSGQAEERYRQAVSIGCNGALLVSSGQKQNVPALGLESFRHRAQKQQRTQGLAPSLSTFNTGMSGRFSQFTNTGILPVRGASSVLQVSTTTRCASLTAQDATRALFASYINNPLKFYIVGANVDFSLSPAIHNSAYDALGMPHRYLKRSTPSLDVLDQLKSDNDTGGAAITQPYKIEVVQRLDSLSTHARVIRAVNTILPIRQQWSTSRQPTDLDIVTTRNRCGPIYALHGDNTDWIGMRACLRRGLSPINAVRKNTVGLVIGAGGMARAAVYAMLHMGVQHIVICNRTQSTAEELAAYYNEWLANDTEVKEGPQSQAKVSVLPTLDSKWPSNLRLPTMIISSVPAENINGKLEARFTLPSELLASPSGGVVVEVTYKPLATALVRQVIEQASRGWVILTGLDMLREQAFAQFELFTGRRAPRHVMRDAVVEEYQRQQF